MILSILDAGVVIDEACFVVGVDVDYLDTDVGVDVGVAELFIDLNFRSLRQCFRQRICSNFSRGTFQMTHQC